MAKIHGPYLSLFLNTLFGNLDPKTLQKLAQKEPSTMMKTVGDVDEEINVRTERFEVPYLKIMRKRHDAVENGHIRLDLYKRALTSEDKYPDLLCQDKVEIKGNGDKNLGLTSKGRKRDLLTATIWLLYIED